MKKKILALVLVLALAATGVVGGSMAYLTDEDSASNVFTVGEVDIEVTEEVGVVGAGSVSNNDDGASYTGVMPGDYLKKEVTVSNIGDNDAYVAVTVTLRNEANNFAYLLNLAIDEFYGDDKAQAVYDEVFDGWDMNHSKDLDGDGVEEAGMRLTIDRETSNKLLKVDEVKTISEYWQQASDNWYLDDDTVIPYDGYYTSDMGDYELRYTYYLYLEGKDSEGNVDSYKLFDGLNVPLDFNNDQIEMFNGLIIDVEAKAIQADNVASEKAAFDNLMGVAADTWDGTVDTTWYDPENPLTEYNISTAEQLAGLAELVSGDTTFAGVTFNLTGNVDLYCEDTSENADGDPVTFRPIGDHSKDGTFEGIFDGNGHTVSNLYQNGWDLGYQWGAYGSYGLFGNLNDATVKNLTISGTESYIEGGDVSFVAGSATGDCVFENITIEDGVAATYNNGCGGIIGWSGAGNYTFKNITIEEDVVLAGLWGSFDSSIGGIVGQGEPGATYNFENIDIKCRLDAYNDVTASYKYYIYRMTGMLIGRLEETTSIDGRNYPDMSKYNITCNNVTVTYGDWVNYHYCVVAGKTAWRVEPGYAYEGVPADHDHSTCAMHCNELLPFQGLFGGDQYGVNPIEEYTGVTLKGVVVTE